MRDVRAIFGVCFWHKAEIDSTVLWLHLIDSYLGKPSFARVGPSGGSRPQAAVDWIDL